jgi:hypothetical protein
MRRDSPPIHPAAIGQRSPQDVFESVRTQAHVDILALEDQCDGYRSAYAKQY